MKTTDKIKTALQELLDNPNIKITELAKKHNIGRKSLYYHLSTADILNRKLSQFDHSFFNTIDTEEKAYWLGFIMADGCIVDTHYSTLRLTINLAIIDYSHLVKFHNSIKSNKNINTTLTMCSSNHYSNDLCNGLISHGCFPRKTFIIKFPIISEHLVRHFVRGYFDGDGCICYHKNKNQKGGPRLSFLGTNDMLNGILHHITNIGIKIKNIQLYGGISRLDISGYKEAKFVAKWMYDGSNIYLDRKFQHYKEWC